MQLYLQKAEGKLPENISVETDVEYAKAGPEDAIFITGSLYLVGELRHAWMARRKVASR